MLWREKNRKFQLWLFYLIIVGKQRWIICDHKKRLDEISQFSNFKLGKTLVPSGPQCMSILMYLINGSITVWRNNCLTGLDSASLWSGNYRQIESKPVNHELYSFTSAPNCMSTIPIANASVKAGSHYAVNLLRTVTDSWVANNWKIFQLIAVT